MTAEDDTTPARRDPEVDAVLELVIAIGRAYRALEAGVRPYLAERGLGLSEFAVLEILLHKGPLTHAGIILGSTRPNRLGEQVAHWVLDIASSREDARFELVDLRDYPLPHLDEPLPPSFGQYQHDHTKEWAAKIGSFDGFVIVSPEYNHGTSGV